MKSPTYGELNMRGVAEEIAAYYERNKHYGTPFHLVIGTDSQNFSDTKVVVVVTVQCVGHGGIYFYDVQHVERISSVRVKLNYETMQSLKYADLLLEEFEKENGFSEAFLAMDFKIHVDAGISETGKTKELIPGIVGWIKSCGYECEVKPNSYAASSIADRISK